MRPLKRSQCTFLPMFSRGIGSKVVAEGIESRGEAMVLSRNKVVLVQGYNSAGQSTIVMLPISS